MAIQLATHIESIGEGLWNWSVWIEGDSLATVEEVIYTLDPSFCNPVRRSRDAASRFKVHDVTSAPFTIFARIKSANREHMLDLYLRPADYAAGPGLAVHGNKTSKPSIMAVDDDINVLEAVVQDLRRRYAAHFKIVRASSGKQGLELLQIAKANGTEVAMIVADQRMPIMAGTEFLCQARQYYPNSKRVLLTAFADTKAAIEAINFGRISYYISKPWDPPEERLYPFLDELLSDWQPARRARFNAE